MKFRKTHTTTPESMRAIWVEFREASVALKAEGSDNHPQALREYPSTPRWWVRMWRRLRGRT